ncbi:MAG TPA: MFS transporter [Planctomycetaceae bacterium]|jgi:acyl-[acyl-carrier-protein]-phospholipid O-acyltransferase/long-chain-fatty-acid--[acyl-carrier-protein] ligase|nr:MFS transporter [Planctomycetaceae bacterium]
MTAPDSDVPARDPRPSLWRDVSFYGMTFTQFFGAFNDNLFKQLVLLICVDYFLVIGTDYQPYAQFMFALPFVLFSGFAGFLSDRIPKVRIVVAMKIAEIVVMIAGLFALRAVTGRIEWLLLVVFLMGTHSAFFGPPKYGILPELFREPDLPQVNGMIQMTTFLSIILGMALGSFIKEWYRTSLWVGSAVCIGIAVVGTLTSFVIRSTPIARPGLKFTPSALFISGETWRMLKSDRPLLVVLMVSSLFWFLGGVIQQSVNAFGRLQMEYGDGRTGLLAVCMAIGIMVGCLWAGIASKGKFRTGFVKVGAWGVVASLSGLAAVGSTAGVTLVRSTPVSSASSKEPKSTGAESAAQDDGVATAPAGESLVVMLRPTSLFEVICRVLLTSVGFFAGLFYVPLAVVMQVRPPADKKGRMIGAMNLVNWIFILIAAGFYLAVIAVCSSLQIRVSWIFVLCAAVMLPVALFYRPSIELQGEAA